MKVSWVGKILWPEMAVWVQVPLAVPNFISLKKTYRNINLNDVKNLLSNRCNHRNELSSVSVRDIY